MWRCLHSRAGVVLDEPQKPSSNWQEQSNDADGASRTRTEAGAYPQGRPGTHRSPDAGEAGADDRRAGISAPGADRKAIRQQTTEPLDAFRRYLTTSAFAQAVCHLG